VLILVVRLYGTLVLAERRLGYVTMLLASIGGAGVFVIFSARGLWGLQWRRSR
jgi:hypothetical protein